MFIRVKPNLLKVPIRAVTIAIIVLLTNCQSKAGDLYDLCEDVHSSGECAQRIEEHQLKQYKRYVNRLGNKIVLKLNNGKDIFLEDVDKEAEGIWYSFRDFYKSINSYLIHIQYYEGTAYLLINKSTGEQIKIFGEISLSPDSKRLISYNADFLSRYSRNGFQIYKVTGNKYIKEFEYEPEDWEPSNVKWIGNYDVEIEKTGWNRDESNLTVIGKVVYTFDNNKWVEKE